MILGFLILIVLNLLQVIWLSFLSKPASSNDMRNLELSWIGEPQTVSVLRDLVRERKPDFLFLIETISISSMIDDLRGLGFANSFVVDRVGRSGGLSIFLRVNVDCSISSYSQNHIDVIFSERNLEVWRMSCFYSYPERARMKNSWELNRRLAGVLTLPWCIMSDYNDMLYQSKRGKHLHPRSLMEGFRLAIEESMLTEIELSGGLYTWEKSRGKEDWVQERIDRAFAMGDWHSKFPLCKLTMFKASVSDHDPIFLELVHVMKSKREFRFRFENT